MTAQFTVELVNHLRLLLDQTDNFSLRIVLHGMNQHQLAALCDVVIVFIRLPSL